MIAGSGRSPGESHGNALQYSFLENPRTVDWQATVRGVAQSWTRLKQLSMHCEIESAESMPWAFLVVQWLRIRLPMEVPRFSHWLGKIPHAGEQQSPWASTLSLLSTREATAMRSPHCSQRQLLATTRESPHAATKTQCSQIKF